MSTEKRDRIEELPASDMQLASEERDRPSPLRSPPGEPHDLDEAQRSSPPPETPDSGLNAPAPADPDPEE